MHAVGANADHGVRRTNADKEKAVTIALTDPTISGMSDSQISINCRVSQPYVGKIRKKLTYNGYRFEATRVCSDGRIMDISGITARKNAVPAPVEPEAPVAADNNDEVAGPSDNDNQENLEDQESNPETNVDTVPGDNDLVTGTQGDANVPPEPVDNNSETGGSEDGDEDDLDTEDNAPDSDDVTELENTETDPASEVDDPEEPETVDSDTSDEVVIEETDEIPGSETDNQDVTQNESGDEGNDLDLDDTTELGAGENDPDDNVDTDDEESALSETETTEDEPEIDGDSGNTDGTTDPEVIVPPENDALDAIEDINTLKSMILELTTVKTNQEKEIEIKNNQIADLEKEVDELKSENEYLKIQLQGRADSESEVSASLYVNGMEDEEEENVYSMA